MERCRRSKIFIEAGHSLGKMIDLALKYSGHPLKSKNLLAMLTRSSRFQPDNNFSALDPVYSVSPEEIEQRIKSDLEKLSGN